MNTTSQQDLKNVTAIVIKQMAALSVAEHSCNPEKIASSRASLVFWLGKLSAVKSAR